MVEPVVRNREDQCVVAASPPAAVSLVAFFEISDKIMRTIFIHCGLHKTGTTSIQNFFFNQRSRLAKSGLLYPHTGIPGQYIGHHNLAWLMGRDHRFTPGAGTFENLWAEINEFEGNVLISSEDFESSLGRPERWENLLSGAEKRGFITKIIVYFRSQARYLESMFLTSLSLNNTNLFDTFFEQCIDHGFVRDRDAIYHFDYSKILKAHSDNSNFQFTARLYREFELFDSVADLLSITGLSGYKYSSASSPKLNERYALDTHLLLHYKNRFGVDFPEKLSSMMAEGFSEVTLSAESEDAIRLRFDDCNRDFAERIGNFPIDEWFNGKTEIDATQVDIQKVFSFSTGVHMRMLSAKHDLRLATNKDIHRWRAWVSAIGGASR